MTTVAMLAGVLVCYALSTNPAQEYHWENVNGSWYYQNQQGLPKVGKFADVYGDVYITDDTGKCLTGYVNGELYGEDCRLINQACKTDYEADALKYSAGEDIYLEDVQSLHSFCLYYTSQVSLYKQGAKREAVQVVGSKDCTLQAVENVDRDALLTKLHNRVGVVKGATPYETLITANARVASLFNYGLEYSRDTFDSFLDTTNGVCWHFSRALEEILQSEGIYSEVVVGRQEGQWHAWVRSKIDNRWVYSDPVQVKANGIAFADIPYDYYVNSYQVVDTVGGN